MLNITLNIEDLIISAAPMAAESATPDKWDVVVIDRHHKIVHNCLMTCLQVSAIAALAIGYGEEGGNPDAIEELYKIARPALTDCPKECYPIP